MLPAYSFLAHFRRLHLRDRHLAKLIGMIGPMEERRFFVITTTYAHTFFEVYLRHAPASQIEGIRSLYPEVQLWPPA